MGAAKQFATFWYLALLVAVHGLRDEDSGARAISVHTHSQQREMPTLHNKSSEIASTGCFAPTTPGKWVRFTIGKANYAAGLPFVGVVLSGIQCAEAISNLCHAKKALAEAMGTSEGKFDEMKDENEGGCDNEKLKDIVVMQCEKNRAWEGVGTGCILGLAYACASTAAACATAGKSTIITAPLAAALDVAGTMNTCWNNEHKCGFTSFDPKAELDTCGLLSGKNQTQIGKMTKIMRLLTGKSCAINNKPQWGKPQVYSPNMEFTGGPLQAALAEID